MVYYLLLDNVSGTKLTTYNNCVCTQSCNLLFNTFLKYVFLEKYICQKQNILLIIIADAGEATKAQVIAVL